MTNPDSRQASSGFKQTSFLPEPDFNPIYPKTDCGRVHRVGLYVLRPEGGVHHG